jgi:hypothetical protein
MSFQPHFSVPVVTSGLCGGMSKIITAQVPLTILSVQSVFDVALYALISAVIGYGVNKGIDALSKKYKNRPRK